MKNSYRILGTSLLTLGLVGCFEVPSRDHLVTAQGIVPNLSCHQPPLVALAAEALPREFGITVWNLYKGQRKNWHEGMTAFAQDQDLLLLQESATKPDMLAWLQAGRFQAATASLYPGRRLIWRDDGGQDAPGVRLRRPFPRATAAHSQIGSGEPVPLTGRS